GALTGDPDTAASFDGATGAVSVPDDASLRLNGAFSIEFWARETSFVNTWPGILRKGGATATGYLIYYKPDGTLSFKRGGTEAVTASGALSTNRWRQFVVTYDGSTLRWFVDGALNAS